MQSKKRPSLAMSYYKLVLSFFFLTSILRLKKSTNTCSLPIFEVLARTSGLTLPETALFVRHFLTMTDLSCRSITLTSLICLNYIITIPPKNSFLLCMNEQASRSKCDFPTPGSPNRKVTGVERFKIFLFRSNRSTSLQIDPFLLN